MKIAVYSHHQFEKEFINKANTNKYGISCTSEELSTENADLAKGCDVVMLFSSDKASKEVLQKFKEMGIGLVVTRSAGTDHIDLQAAEALGIKVANVPSYSPNAIAEHVIALVLALYRKLKTSFSRISNYNFSLDGQVGTEIKEKVFGICGTGDIGEALAFIAKGFGAEILLFDEEENENLHNRSWAKYTTKEDLLKRCDIISLNLPLNEATKNFIAKQELGQMKNSAILINTGRGGLVDTEAVKNALETTTLGGFGMDVYENEKGIFYKDLSDTEEKDRLLESLIARDDVVVTAHQAFLTHTALTNMMETVFESIAAYDEDGKLEYQVTP